MLADKFLSNKFGPGWKAMSPVARKVIVGSLLGATTVGSGLAAQKLLEERKKRDLE